MNGKLYHCYLGKHGKSIKEKEREGSSIKIDEPRRIGKGFLIPPEAIAPKPAGEFSPTPVLGLTETSKGGFSGLGLDDINFSMNGGKRKQKPKKVRLLINEK